MLRNRSRRCSTAYRLRESSVFTLTPVSAAISLKLRPSSSCATNTSRCSSGSSPRRLEFIEKHAAGVKRLGSGFEGREQVFQPQQVVVLAGDGGIADALRPLSAEEIG